MTAIVMPHGPLPLIWCMVSIRTCVCYDSRSVQKDRHTRRGFRVSVTLPSVPNICRGGPETILPIWKQLLVGLDHLMDGEIFRGRPAEPDDRGPINHTPPSCSPLTYAHPREDPQGSRVLSRHLKLLTLTLDHRKANVITLNARLQRSLLSFSQSSCGNVERD